MRVDKEKRVLHEGKKIWKLKREEIKRSVGQKQQEIKLSKRRVNPRSGLMGQAWTDVKMKGRRQ